ncbi:ABC-2 transporter permease [Clostridium botulinum]|uniref:Membrane protein n=1 Tax=Clostridium botulinum C/D str. DC5 TaxID=1443128 RepID=A0A0A0IGP8_CLOBO|nr:ABC-2 transporter permease [Clostridium botulinum]KGM98710.1 membrane protein [Clostridium botulinum C/D str. DC5]KOC55105.1 hypothetical protein ADU89_06240 [Clostridium botulinum]KOC55358.1 hypothetical protein ADU90_11085 [Clostridium botulinum]MCD3234514.1 hypothetical protein [Clostridium botulinum D/C]MCD3240410.1 hypothetical protein [Clostridium botulinum D/C]
MKNYFNKALIYKEWRNIRALALLFSLEVIGIIILPFIDRIREIRFNMEINKNENIYIIRYYFHHHDDLQLPLIATAILIGTIIVGSELMGRKYDDLNSLPFKREEIILSKWVVSVLVIVVPLVIGFGLVHLLYHMNEDIIGKAVTNKMILTWSTISILIPVFVLTFIMLIQTLSGKHLIGGIVGGIFLVFPLAFGALFFMAMDIFKRNPNFVNFVDQHFDGISNKLYIFARIITPAAYGFDLRLEKPNGYEVYTFDSFFSPRVRIIFLIVFTILAFILMVYAFKKVPIERCGYIVIFKPLEIIFKIGVSVCFGLLGSAIISPMIESHYDLRQLQNGTNFVHVINKACTLTVLIGLLCGCIVYVIINKIIEANKR